MLHRDHVETSEIHQAQSLIAAFERWELSPSLLEKTLGLSREEFARWAKNETDFRGNYSALGAWLSLDQKLAKIYPSEDNGQLERIWWSKPHESFGGKSPKDLIEHGSAKELLWVNYCVDGFLRFQETQ